MPGAMQRNASDILASWLDGNACGSSQADLPTVKRARSAMADVVGSDLTKPLQAGWRAGEAGTHVLMQQHAL
jgi:hypothetical protein